MTFSPVIDSTKIELEETRGPFQSQLTILQNAINNWHTLHDNISDPQADTLSQTGVSCSYPICYSKICTLSEITIIDKRLLFESKLNFSDTNSCYRRK